MTQKTIESYDGLKHKILKRITEIIKDEEDYAILRVASHNKEDVWYDIHIDFTTTPPTLKCECKGYKFNGKCSHINILAWELSVFKDKGKRLLKGVADTSMEAFRELTPDELGKRQNLVYNAVKELGEATDRQILKHIRKTIPVMDINSITPRRGELVKGGLVVQSGTMIDPDTGKMAKIWTLKGNHSTKPN